MNNDGEETPLNEGGHYRYSDEHNCELSARTDPSDNDVLVVAVSFPTVYDIKSTSDGGDVQLPWDQVVMLRDALSVWLDDTPVARPYDGRPAEMAESWCELYDCDACGSKRTITTGHAFAPCCGAKVDWSNK